VVLGSSKHHEFGSDAGQTVRLGQYVRLPETTNQFDGTVRAAQKVISRH
jgi:hypothetical protein